MLISDRKRTLLKNIYVAYPRNNAAAAAVVVEGSAAINLCVRSVSHVPAGLGLGGRLRVGALGTEHALPLLLFGGHGFLGARSFRV